MSLETWKQEFYPVSAEEAVVDAITAVDHSIKKWEGLRPNTLANHQICTSASNRRIGEFTSLHDIDSHFIIAAETCALCVLNEYRCDGKYYGCDMCPIVEVTGRPCDGSFYDDDDEEDVSPWNIWLLTADPEPMIALLYQTRDGIINPENIQRDESI